MTDNEINYSELFQEWLKTATYQDKELYGAVLHYEQEYFPEMTFKPDSIVLEFIKIQAPNVAGQLVDSYTDVPDELLGIDYADYRFYVKDLNGDFVGCVNSQDRSMIIIPEHINNKATILHEMIHIYESNIASYAQFYRDILFICLYNDLKSKIPGLDDRIVRHTHVVPGDKITTKGGSHGILFFLKSLDLDLRCGYKLGTVCGYGREDM